MGEGFLLDSETFSGDSGVDSDEEEDLFLALGDLDGSLFLRLFMALSSLYESCRFSLALNSLRSDSFLRGSSSSDKSRRSRRFDEFFPSELFKSVRSRFLLDDSRAGLRCDFSASSSEGSYRLLDSGSFVDRFGDKESCRPRLLDSDPLSASILLDGDLESFLLLLVDSSFCLSSFRRKSSGEESFRFLCSLPSSCLCEVS